MWLRQTALAAESGSAMDSGAAAMDAMASEAAAGVADSVVTRLGQKNGQDLKSDGYRTWIVPKGRKADQETLKAYVNSKLCLVRLTLTPTPTLTRTRTEPEPERKP